MLDHPPAILIAEDQIFIALEAERILSEAFDCTVEVCRRDRLPDVLAEKYFQIVLLDFTGNPEEDLPYIFLARQAGAQLMLLTASDDPAAVAKAFPDVPLIRKPFHELEVRTFVGQLLKHRQTA